VRGAVAVAHCVQLVVAIHDKEQPPTTTRRSSARSRGLRTLGGWAWACAVGYGTRCSSSRMRRRRLGLQQLDGMGFHPASPSSALKAQCKARCLAVWADSIILRPVRLDWRVGSREGGRSSTWARRSSVWRIGGSRPHSADPHLPSLMAAYWAERVLDRRNGVAARAARGSACARLVPLSVSLLSLSASSLVRRSRLCVCQVYDDIEVQSWVAQYPSCSRTRARNRACGHRQLRTPSLLALVR
jgi:hypothetical protein